MVAILKLPDPSKDPEPVTAPVKEIVLAVANLVAVPALPDTLPVTLPVKGPLKEGAETVLLNDAIPLTSKEPFNIVAVVLPDIPTVKVFFTVRVFSGLLLALLHSSLV